MLRRKFIQKRKEVLMDNNHIPPGSELPPNRISDSSDVAGWYIVGGIFLFAVFITLLIFMGWWILLIPGIFLVGWILRRSPRFMINPDWKFNRIDQVPRWLGRTIGVVIAIIGVVFLIRWIHPLDRWHAYEREQHYKDVTAQNQQNYYSPHVATPPPPAPVVSYAPTTTVAEPAPEQHDSLTIDHKYDLYQGKTYKWYNNPFPKLFIPVNCGTSVRVYCSSKDNSTHWISVFIRNADSTVSNYYYDMFSRYKTVPEGVYTARLLPSKDAMVRIKFTETKE